MEAALATDHARLRSILECILFVAGEPVPAARVARALSLEEEEVAAALEEMRYHYGFSGLEVTCVAGGYQLSTRPEFAPIVAQFLQPAAQKISRQAMETLAIIAYKQPVTLPEIDALRGVDSSGVVNTLLERGLICEAGRRAGPGRAILYRTTDGFLKYLGLADLSELPPFKETADDEVEATPGKLSG
ncbi:MAG: SMC-Scp complex subunit ScpB [Armatimonadetes bacterium]|nr:SMC-Scp complex subunit ScpB [Armatimonadota bacterium]